MTTPHLPRDELAAALAARKELGPDYDDAFIEKVVDRIEETLATRAGGAPSRRKRVVPGAPGADSKAERGSCLALAIVSLVAAIPLSAIATYRAGMAGLLVTWAAIVLVNLVYSHRPR